MVETKEVKMREHATLKPDVGGMDTDEMGEQGTSTFGIIRAEHATPAKVASGKLYVWCMCY